MILLIATEGICMLHLLELEVVVVVIVGAAIPPSPPPPCIVISLLSG